MYQINILYILNLHNFGICSSYLNKARKKMQVYKQPKA